MSLFDRVFLMEAGAFRYGRGSAGGQLGFSTGRQRLGIASAVSGIRRLVAPAKQQALDNLHQAQTDVHEYRAKKGHPDMNSFYNDKSRKAKELRQNLRDAHAARLKAGFPSLPRF